MSEAWINSPNTIEDNAVAYILAVFLLAGFHITLYIIILIVYLLIKRSVIYPGTLLLKKNELGRNIIRIIGYILMVILIYSYISSPLVSGRFIIWEFLHYIFSIATVGIYIIWVCSLKTYKL